VLFKQSQHNLSTDNQWDTLWQQTQDPDVWVMVTTRLEAVRSDVLRLMGNHLPSALHGISTSKLQLDF
jgi:hypothetical protein